MINGIVNEIVKGPGAWEGIGRLSARICANGTWNGEMQRIIAERLLRGLLTYTVYCEEDGRHRLSFIYDLLTNINAFLDENEIEDDEDWPDPDSELSETKEMIFRCANTLELLAEESRLAGMDDQELAVLKAGWGALIRSAGYRDGILDGAAMNLENALDVSLDCVDEPVSDGGDLV